LAVASGGRRDNSATQIAHCHATASKNPGEVSAYAPSICPAPKTPRRISTLGREIVRIVPTFEIMWAHWDHIAGFRVSPFVSMNGGDAIHDKCELLDRH
jgi:hypothetical protein